MAKVIVDHREDKKMVVALAKAGIDYEIKQLNVGDFILQTRIGDDIETIAIERKVQNDFLNSIFDKRLLVQLMNLKENYKNILLVIEGDENLFSMRDIHPNAIRGMLLSLLVDFKVQIIYTRNYKDTALYIKCLIDKLGKIRKPVSLSDRRKPLTKDEYKLYMIESLPGVGPVLAKNLFDRFGSVKGILSASLNELKSVEGVGIKKAEKIKEVLE
jgi:Fanconi anemia group M protein